MSGRLSARMRVSVALLAVGAVGLGACGDSKTTTADSGGASSSSTSALVTTTTVATPTTTAAAVSSSTTAKPAATTTSKPAAAATTHKYTKADNGKTVAVAVGDKIEVTLEECAGSCGYHWEQTAAPDAKVLKKTSDNSTPANNAPGMVGGSGTHVFRYEAVGVGSTSFKLGYFGPGSSTPDESFTLTVKVG